MSVCVVLVVCVCVCGVLVVSECMSESVCVCVCVCEQVMCVCVCVFMSVHVSHRIPVCAAVTKKCFLTKNMFIPTPKHIPHSQQAVPFGVADFNILSLGRFKDRDFWIRCNLGGKASVMLTEEERKLLILGLCFGVFKTLLWWLIVCAVDSVSLAPSPCFFYPLWLTFNLCSGGKTAHSFNSPDLIGCLSSTSLSASCAHLQYVSSI